MKNNKSVKKVSTLSICLLLTMIVAIGGTLAYLFTFTNSVVNTFTPVGVSNSISESFDNYTKSNVKVQNTGDIDAYIRAKVVITWQDENGNVYPTAPVEGTDYRITYATGTHWTKGTDGFWYHTTAVASKDYTDILISEAVQLKNAPAGYSLHVEILSQAIQAEPDAAVESAWPVDANSGTLTLS